VIASYCGECGGRFEADARFCGECGAPREDLAISAAADRRPWAPPGA
jgi:hypothetical protein